MSKKSKKNSKGDTWEREERHGKPRNPEFMIVYWREKQNGLVQASCEAGMYEGFGIQ